MRLFITTACVLLALAMQIYAASKPNVILIYTDDQGYGDASCLNPDSKFQTPSLDRLAKEGISFTDAHCSDTVCTPSRYGLLTGRYSWRTKLKKGVFGAEATCLITDDRMTVASLLKERGYKTAMVGKWHLGMDFPGEVGSRDWTKPVRDMPLDKGFDYYYGIPASMNYGVLAWFEGRYAAVPPILYTAKKPNRLAISDYRMKPPYQQSAAETKRVLGKAGLETAADFVDSECLTRFTDKAIGWIEQHVSSAEAQPFFLYLPYTSPHKPVIPLPQFRGQGSAGAYGEFMIETDHHVGRILDCLTRLRVDRDTLILLTSDNGPETTWKQRRKKYGHGSNHIYREGKRSIYEGGHRVPFFARWPAGIAKPGRTCDRPICQTDVLATLAELTGGELSDSVGEDSVSFLDVLMDETGKNSSANAGRSIVHHGVNGRLAIRSGKWKLVMPWRKLSAELYDLETDPSESKDLISQYPAIRAKLTDEITRIVCSGRTIAGISQPNDTDYWSDLAWLSQEEYETTVAELTRAK